MYLASDYIHRYKDAWDCPPTAGSASTSPTICVMHQWLSARSYLTTLVAEKLADGRRGERCQRFQEYPDALEAMYSMSLRH
jgi:hypothetical protein